MKPQTDTEMVAIRILDAALDADYIVELLQRKEFNECQYQSKEVVKQALAHWFSELLDAIEADPDWFINRHCAKHFFKHLPERED